MIVCSCAMITDQDIKLALLDILSQPNAPLPTPGVVYRHLAKKMNCCGCVPLTVKTIYATMDELECMGLVCPYACAAARSRLLRLSQRTIRPKIGPDTAPGEHRECGRLATGRSMDRAPQRWRLAS